MSLVVPPIDSAEPIREAAKSLLGTFQAVAGTADAISTTWSGLASVYFSPEESIVHSAMNKPDNYARTVQGHADTMYAALDAYATRLEELQKVREQLVKDIADHEARLEATPKDTGMKVDILPNGMAKPAKDQNNDVGPELLEEANALEQRVRQFVTDVEDAQRECGNKLNATWGGAQFVQADKTDVNNQHVYGSSFDGKEEATRRGAAPWGAPDAWKYLNGPASGIRTLGGAWNSFLGNIKDLSDLIGIGGDEGATQNKRSALLKFGEYAFNYAQNLSPVAPYIREFSPEEQKRYEESSAAMFEALKGVISYDTWGADPHGTIGSLAPDVVGAATGGWMGRLGFKMLGKLSPNLALRISDLRQLLRLRNIGNWNHDLRDWFQKFGQMSPDSGAAVELERLRGVVADGAHGGKSPDGSDATPTVPRQGAGPIETGARSGDGAGSGGAGSRGGVRDGSGHGGDGHPRGVEGHGGVRDRDAEHRQGAGPIKAGARSGDGAGHGGDGHPRGVEGHGGVRDRDAEHGVPRRRDAEHSHGPEEQVGDSARRRTDGVEEDATPRRALDGEDARGQGHAPGDESGHDAGRSGGSGDSSPEVPDDETPRLTQTDDGPRFDENGGELYGDDGKPLVHDRGDGRIHYASDPEGTYRSLENGRWKLKNLDDGKYASDLYAGGDKDINYPASKPSYGSHEWRDTGLRELSKADKEVWDAIRDQARHDRELATEAVKQAEKLGVEDVASKSYRQIAKDLGEIGSTSALEAQQVLNKAGRSLSRLRDASEWLGDRAGFLRNEDLGRETIIGRPGDSPGVHGSPGPGKFDQVAIEGDNRIYFEENKGGDGVKLGARDVEAGGRAQQGSLPYLEDLVTGGRQDPRILETLKRMKANGNHEAFFKNLAEGKVEVKYEIVNARTNGAVRAGEFDLGGKVRIKWDGKGDIEVIKE